MWQIADAGHLGAPLVRQRLDDPLERLAVLALLDRLDRGADQLDAVLLQHAGLGQAHRGVERGLAAEGRQQRVGALLGDHLLDELRRDRLDVGRVGELRVGHDRRRVGVDQDDAQALLLQHPAGLGAGVVELAGLADHDRAGADHQDADLMSSRLGIGTSSIRSHEPVEEVRRVVRAGGRLGVVLHRERLQPTVVVAQLEALDHVVVEADVADRGDAVRRGGGLVERRVDGEPVVVRGHLDLAGGAVHHRLVDAAVAVLQLVGAEPERPAEQLVAEADAEVGQPALQRSLQQLDLAGRRRPGRRGRWRRRARRARPPAPRRGWRSPAARAPRCRARPSGAASST